MRLITAPDLAAILDETTVVQAAWAAEDPGGPYLPNALSLDTDSLECGYPSWHLREPAALARALGDLGVPVDRPVAIAGQTLLAAARMAWVLRYLGHPEVVVVDGGVRAWIAAGLPIQGQPALAAPKGFPVDLNPRIACWDEDLDGRRDCVVVDVRSAEEFAGHTSGYRTLIARGRIPGSLHGGDFAEGSSVAFRPDGTLRPAQEIAQHWERSGIPLDRRLVFVCGGGWRASLAFLVADQLGLDAAVLPNGWSGWSTCFVPDANAGPPSPGWRQEPTERPVQSG